MNLRRIALCLVLLGIAGCNRHRAADVTLDADAAQRNATATKTLGDIAAAESASRSPAPVVHDAAPASAETKATTRKAEPPADETLPPDDAEEVETNG